LAADEEGCHAEHSAARFPYEDVGAELRYLPAQCDWAQPQPAAVRQLRGPPGL